MLPRLSRSAKIELLSTLACAFASLPAASSSVPLRRSPQRPCRHELPIRAPGTGAAARDSAPAESRRRRSRAQVTISQTKGETVEEARVNGTLVWIKVTPRHGRPYYLIPGRRRRIRISAATASTRGSRSRCGCFCRCELTLSRSYPFSIRQPLSPARLRARHCPMSVYTPVTTEELDAWLARYAVGSLVELAPIAAGHREHQLFRHDDHGAATC